MYSMPNAGIFSVIAFLGYLVGRRGSFRPTAVTTRRHRDLTRAKIVIQELDRIAAAIHHSLEEHSATITRFEKQITELIASQDIAWNDLCFAAEELLKPTLSLAGDLARGYDEIRHQSGQLMAYSEIRTDSLTRVRNRDSLHELLESSFALLKRYDQQFSIAIFNVDHFKAVNDDASHLYGDSVLQSVAVAMETNVRETDAVARCGGDEFVVVMPHTDLNGATAVAERVREIIASQLSITVSGGVAHADRREGPEQLLTRAGSALRSAKLKGRNQLSSAMLVGSGLSNASHSPALLSAVAC
jgi:diguanylate cyclase (GGDEF)-like protein